MRGGDLLHTYLSPAVRVHWSPTLNADVHSQSSRATDTSSFIFSHFLGIRSCSALGVGWSSILRRFGHAIDTLTPMDRIDENHQFTYDILRDCLSAQIVRKTRTGTSISKKSKRQSRQRKAQSWSTPAKGDEDEVAELADFVDV
jgi:hypothetical protein